MDEVERTARGDKAILAQSKTTLREAASLIRNREEK